MAAVTRLGLYGGPRALAGDFSGKDVAVVVVVAGRRGGGWQFMMDFDVFRKKRDDDEEKRKKDLAKVKALKDKTDREIGELLQRQIQKEARVKQIRELERLVAKTTAQDLIDAKAHNVAQAFARAALQKNFSAIEALEREMDRKIEEEDFLMLALVILR